MFYFRSSKNPPLWLIQPTINVGADTTTQPPQAVPQQPPSTNHLPHVKIDRKEDGWLCPRPHRETAPRLGQFQLGRSRALC